MKLDPKETRTLWITRGDQWVPTVECSMSGTPRLIRVTNISDAPCTVDRLTAVGLWLRHGIPRKPGYVSVGSRRSKSWETLAYEATEEETLAIREEWRRERLDKELPPCVERREYTTPTKILKRGDKLGT